MRKIYIILVVLILGMIGMTYLYFSNLNTETSTNDLSLKVAASNSAIIFSFDNDKTFYDILSGQNLIQQVIGESNSKLFSSVKKILVDDKSINSLINGQKIYIGVTTGEKAQVDFLISTQSENVVDNLFDKIKIPKTKVNNTQNIYQFNFTDSTSCYVGIKNKLVIISNSLNQVEHSIKSTIKEDKFSNFIKTNSRFNKNTLANLYLDFNKAPSILKEILSSNLVGELNVFNKQNTYAAFSYNFSTERLLLNGSTVVNDENNFQKLFTNNSEQKITITNILPDKTANYTAYAVSNYSNWSKDLTKLMAYRNEDQVIKIALQKINETYRIDLSTQFPLYFKNQLLTFQLSTGEKFGAIALKNGDKVSQLFLDLSREYAQDIRIFKEPNIAYAFFGDPFKKFEKPFYTIIDGYLVMANNASSIQSFLNSYHANKMLINDGDYQNFSNQLSSSSTIVHYINKKNSLEIFGRNLKQSFYKKLISKNEMGGFTAFCYQLSGDKDKFLSNILLYKTAEKEIKIGTTTIAQ